MKGKNKNQKIGEWIKKAEQDIDTAQYNLQGGKAEAAAFFAQQAAEKALKALFILKYSRLWKIHDLVILARKLNAPSEIIDLCKKLTPAYVYTRYPDVIPVEDAQGVAEELVNNGKEILKWVKENI